MKQGSYRHKGLSIMLVLALFIGLVQFSVPLTAYAATSYTAGTYNELAAAISAANDGDTISITADIVVNAQLTVASSVTINGNGHIISVPQPGLLESGLLNKNGSKFCVFFINAPGKSVTLNDITLYGGVYGEQISSRSNRYFGGAVVVNNGRFNLYNSTVSRSGGMDAIGGNQCAAGGICNEANGVVFISNCYFNRNAASFGGSFVNYGKMFIENSTFSENRSLSTGGGGGAGQNNGTLYINNSTFSNNNSTELGGAINDLTTACTYILNSTFTGNVSYNSIYGGGALRGSMTTTVLNCLFAYNYDYAGGSLALNDIADILSGSTNTSSYYSLYHGTMKANTGNGSGNMHYDGNEDGSDNSLFAGGIYTKVMAADGKELDIGQVFQPFLSKPAGKDTSVVPLKTGSQALGGGCDTAFLGDPVAPEVGYYNGSTSSWQMIIGAHNAAHEVTTDQTGTTRANAVGATELIKSSLHMVKLKYYDAATYGPVSGISIYGDNYESGANATISATPNIGCTFDKWKNASDDSTFSTSNPYTFSVTSDVYIYPTFTMVPTYEITASSISSFGSLVTPYTQPLAQTVTITNTGNQSITLTQPASTNYIIGTLSSTSLPINGSTATFTIRPKANLGVGNYNETITINGSNGATATVDVQFVAAAPTYTISASALSSFGSLEIPYTQPAAQTVTLTNTGNQSITLTQPTSTNYIIGALSSMSLPTNGSTATFTVQPNTNLGVGNYNETITINGSNGTTATVDAQFAVMAAPVQTYSISASALSSFGSHETPYTQPAAQTVTVTNTGNQSVTLSQPTSTNYVIGTLSSTSLPANGSTVTFTVQPKADLGVGNHDETIAINGSNGVTTSVGAQFIVTAGAPTCTISASALSSFGSHETPYTQPTAQTVTVTNTGNQSVTLSQPTSTNYIIGTLSSTSLPANGSTATFTVQPKAGLGVGNYDETIAINGNNGATTSVGAQFIVTAGVQTYTISASELSSFGSLVAPYTRPAAQTVTVTNTGNQSVTLSQPTSTNYIIGTLSSTSLPANGSTATFTVQPKAGLGVGSYSESIVISGNNGATTLVGAQFTITAAYSSDDETDSTPTTPSTSPFSGVDIIVNGDRVNAGTASDSIEGRRSVTIITVDQQKLEQKLAAEGNNALVIVPIDSTSDKLVGLLNGQMVKEMEDRQATLEVLTGSAAYTLPASEINIDAVSAQLGTKVTLVDIIVQVTIASPSSQTATVVKSAAEDGGFSVTVPAVDFNISCTYNGKTVDVSTFNAYVERTVAIPGGVDSSKITTGIVVNPDGSVRHVPTKVTVIGGKYYAVINSLTNSTYTVIWHPIEFSDVRTSWARASINDMGSRMVVNGIGSNKYNPALDIARAEFAAVIVRALGLPPGTGRNNFRDVGASKWYCGYIETATAYGIIQGYDTTTFGPDDRLTREQAMTMIARAMRITGLKSELKDSEIRSLLAGYSDGTAASDFAKTSIAACLKTGIITGRSSKMIAPKSCITRAEVAVMVQRLLQKSGLI